MTDAKCYQATPHGTLLEQIMDSTQPKNEREWAAMREIERNRLAIAELVATGRAVVDRWDSPSWKDLPHTGEYIYALRDAIAKHDTSTTTTKEQSRGHWIRNRNCRGLGLRRNDGFEQ